jgi:hypothetical protein
MIILNWILKGQDVRFWIEFLWLSKKSFVDCRQHIDDIWISSLVSEKRLASQELL